MKPAPAFVCCQLSALLGFTLQPDENEVADVFEVPVSLLFNHENYQAHDIVWEGQGSIIRWIIRVSIYGAQRRACCIISADGEMIRVILVNLLLFLSPFIAGYVWNKYIQKRHPDLPVQRRWAMSARLAHCWLSPVCWSGVWPMKTARRAAMCRRNSRMARLCRVGLNKYDR